eukprot:CAMPEP_0173403534 /NCGR_PEP_ID=MMETSP1356-20130122/57057_1 /TAXON_ID=77927 ORGANISM="Hemiselmis virescens, Strain PCC157" /NCGR_SAMPLE_ID=MMETSP1356 /ASSEMBLY_ACC=CAM_ASM_000847 /LENGTH=135 /DNA_ID=CAMNT_0014364081 /DNA_START=334 /DNA_END=738 /DNA_ORIENTATION=-
MRRGGAINCTVTRSPKGRISCVLLALLNLRTASTLVPPLSQPQATSSLFRSCHTSSPHRSAFVSTTAQRAASAMAGAAPDVKLIDCCVNLGDDMFQGRYNDKQKHDPDFDLVMERATAAGVQRMIGVSGSLSDSQ